jgi:hypothetical protein
MFDIFDIAASITVGVFGQPLSYTQKTGEFQTIPWGVMKAGVDPWAATTDIVTHEFSIQIERNLQIIDETTGAGQYINAAIYANADFPFVKPLEGDLITAPDKTWKVVRKVADDGHVTTLEIR